MYNTKKCVGVCMKNILGIVVSLVVLSQLVWAEMGQISSRELPISEMQKQNREIVKLASSELSKGLPKKIDKYTSLISVDGVDTTLMYTFEINTGVKRDETIIKEDKERMEKAVTYGVCKSNKRFLDSQIDIIYIYRSLATQMELFRFEIDRSKCLQIVNSEYKTI
jgi:hypothetical protein